MGKANLNKSTNIATRHLNAVSNYAAHFSHITASCTQDCAVGKQQYFVVEMTTDLERGRDLARLHS